MGEIVKQRDSPFLSKTMEFKRMGESVIRVKPINHENEKSEAKTGETEDGFLEKTVKMLKKEEMGEGTWSELSPITPQ